MSVNLCCEALTNKRMSVLSALLLTLQKLDSVPCFTEQNRNRKSGERSSKEELGMITEEEERCGPFQEADSQSYLENWNMDWCENTFKVIQKNEWTCVVEQAVVFRNDPRGGRDNGPNQHTYTTKFLGYTTEISPDLWLWEFGCVWIKSFVQVWVCVTGRWKSLRRERCSAGRVVALCSLFLLHKNNQETKVRTAITIKPWTSTYAVMIPL